MQHMQQSQPQLAGKKLSSSLQENMDLFRSLLGNPHDLLIRSFLIGNSNHPCAVIAIDGLANADMLHAQVLGHIQLMISTAEKPFLLNQMRSSTCFLMRSCPLSK